MQSRDHNPDQPKKKPLLKTPMEERPICRFYKEGKCQKVKIFRKSVLIIFFGNFFVWEINFFLNARKICFCYRNVNFNILVPYLKINRK